MQFQIEFFQVIQFIDALPLEHWVHQMLLQWCKFDFLTICRFQFLTKTAKK